MEPHGGNLRRAKERYGLPAGGWLDFSANINPLGPPAVLKQALQQVVETKLQHYPDPESKNLQQVLAHHHGLKPENVLCGNGASQLLWLALAVWPKGRLLLPVPSFSEYERNARLWGHELEFFPARESEQFNFDLEELYRRLAHCSGLILGNPNNPTSTLVPKSDLIHLASRGKYMLVDEAFLDLTLDQEANSLAPLVNDFPNLIVVRAFTKSLAIPGLRLGYALAHETTLEAMKELQVPWSVNSGAQAVGEVFPLLTKYRENTRAWLASEPDYLWQQLNLLPGIKANPPITNFILCRYKKSAAHLAHALAKKGILIRLAGNFRGLDDRYFRVAVRLREENKRLLAALKKAL